MVIKRELQIWLAHRIVAMRSSLGQFAGHAAIANLELSHRKAKRQSRLVSALITVPHYSIMRRKQLPSTVIRD